MEARRQQIDSKSAEAARKSHANLVWEHRLLWLLVIAILGLWGYHYALGRVDRQIRGEILKKLSERFPKHIVQLDRAHLEEGKAIVLEGLEIALPTAEGNRNVLRAQRILASGPIELIGLLQGQVKVNQVRVEMLELSVWPVDSNRWSIQTLSGTEPIPSSLPPIDIGSGLVRIGGASQHQEEMICHDLKAMLRVIGNSKETQNPAASPSLPNDNANTYLSIQASLSSGHFRRIQTETQLRIDKTAWRVSGDLQELEISDRFIALLPDPVRQKISVAKGLNCTSRAKIHIAFERGKWSYGLRGSFSGGQLEHPQLPYRFTNLEGDLFCENGLVQVRNAKASSGGAAFRLEADVRDFESVPKATIVTHVTDLSLDANLYNAIPEPIRATWDKLSLSGLVDAEVLLVFDGKKWKPNATVRSRNVSLQPDVFPYPIRQLRGDFHYHDDVIEAVGLTGIANGQLVRGSLRLEKASPRWLLDLSIDSDAVPIEQNLIAALTSKGSPQSGIERFVRSLQPGGSIQVNRARFTRSRENPETLSKSLELQVYGGSIVYSEFRYPIFDIQGQVTVADDVILLKDFSGRHDSARIACRGRCVCGDGQLEDLLLEFDAQSVPLQEGLHRALPSSVRELWNQAQPSGVLDKVQVKVTKQGSRHPLDVRVSIDEAGLVDAQTGSTVSLRPTMMPYLLNDISFHLEYQPGMLNLNMRGFHDFSVVEASGLCRLRSDGSWGCGFTWLPQTRVMVDQSLLTSLPEQLRQPLIALDYRGPVNVGGSTLFVTDPVSGQPKAEEWNLELDIEDGKLGGGSVASGLRGSVLIQGVATPAGTVATGELMLDSLAIHDVPVLGLTGKFAIVGDKLLLGREASQVELPKGPSEIAQSNSDGVQLASALLPNRSKPLRPDRKLIASPALILPPVKSPYPTPPRHDDDIRANTLSGQMHAYGVGQLNTGRVALQLHLDNADFKNLLLDLGQSPGEANGVLYVDAQLQGSFQNLKTLSGGGVVRLRDAKLYQLPFMIRLFRLMELRAPDNGAFESADVRFSIDGDRFPLEEIALDGDIVSMRGQGWANLRREIHMDLYTYVGPRGQLAAMLGPLWGKESGATWIRVEVDGTTDNPQVKRSFAGIDNTTLEQLFPNKVRKESRKTASVPGL